MNSFYESYYKQHENLGFLATPVSVVLGRMPVCISSFES